MAQEPRSSPLKALELIAINSFPNAITKTQLREATTVGVISATSQYIILSFDPQYQEILNKLQNPEIIKLAVSASAIPLGMTVSLTIDYLKKLVGYNYSKAH